MSKSIIILIKIKFWSCIASFQIWPFQFGFGTLTCVGESRLSAGAIDQQVRVRCLRNGFTQRRGVWLLLHQTLKTRRFNEPENRKEKHIHASHSMINQTSLQHTRPCDLEIQKISGKGGGVYFSLFSTGKTYLCQDKLRSLWLWPFFVIFFSVVFQNDWNENRKCEHNDANKRVIQDHEHNQKKSNKHYLKRDCIVLLVGSWDMTKQKESECWEV